MMYNPIIPGNAQILRVHRGDTFQYPIIINAGSVLHPTRYSLQENDKLYVGIMEPNQPFEFAILKKVYTESSEKTDKGDTLLKLNPIDTQYLHPGTYYWQAKLVQTDGDDQIVTTVVDKTLFYIVE